MKKPFKNKYPAVVEVTMQTYYERLSERNRRQYAAIEAIKLDWGGRTYIGQLLNLSQKTLRKGIEEVQNPLEKADWPPNQQRKPGGGRKVFFLSSPNVLDLFESFLKEYKAGSPTDSNVYWISLTRSQIRRLFAEKHQIQLRSRSIRQMLGRLGYRYRSIQKELATGKCDEREAQFQFIFEMVAAQSLQTPILSIDCKKKELLGNLYREGKCDTIGHQKAYDHDFPNLGKGKIIPHGI
jgi:hypothetical protein